MEKQAKRATEDRLQTKRKVKAKVKEREEKGGMGGTEVESKWSMELHLSQLTTAEVSGMKGESVRPH